MKSYLNQLKIWLKQATHRQRIPLALGLSLLALIALISSTFAWQASKQQTINLLGIERVPQTVELVKLAKDKEGNETDQPLKGTIFALYEVKEKQDQQIGGYYTTDETGKIAVSVPSGNYYFEEITPSPGYTFDQDKTGQLKKRYPFTVTTGASEPVVVTAYNRLITGGLDITKRVVNEDGSPLTEVQKKQDFIFKITFDDKGTYNYQLDNHEELYSLKSGENLTLRHGQQAHFKDIPIGIHYTVTEKQVPRYVTSGSNTSGTIRHEPSIASFLNTYLTTTGQLSLSKEVITGDGSDLTEKQKEQPFTFTVTFSDTDTKFPYETHSGKKGTIQSGDTVTLSHKESLTIGELPLGTTYTVKEEKVPEVTSGQTYWDGTILTAETIYLKVVNEFETDLTKYGTLTFKKEIVSDTPDLEQLFSFEVSLGDKETTYYYQIDEGPFIRHEEGTPIQIKTGQQVHFDHLPAGMSYTIKELPTSHYEGETKEVSGHILTNQPMLYSFINHDQGQPTLTIKKVGVGEGFNADERFDFTLYVNDVPVKDTITLTAGETSQSFPLKVGDRWRVVEKQTNSAYEQTSITNSTGQITETNQAVEVIQTNTYIAPLIQTITGKKHWNIPSEFQNKQPEAITIRLLANKRVVEVKQVTGPNWEYEFKVPVYDTVGEPIAYSIEEEPLRGFVMTADPSSYDITNTYVTPVTSRELTVAKRVTGDTPDTPSNFTFTLTPSQTKVMIQGNGEVTLPRQTFDRPGTYRYTIREEHTGELGYTYDSTVYTWQLVVEEQEGALVITSDTLTKDKLPYSGNQLLFVNHFEESKEGKQQIKGIKTWRHGTNPVNKRPQSIVIQLLADGQVVQQKQVSEKEQWMYQFVAPIYDPDGQKITYTIKEVPVPGYQTTISGYDVTNSFIEESTPINPIKPTDKPNLTVPPKRPGKLLQTNEVRHIGLAIIGLSLLSGVAWFYSNRHQKRSNTGKKK